MEAEKRSSQNRLRRFAGTIAVYLGSSWAIIEATSYFVTRYHYVEYINDLILIILAFGLVFWLLFEWNNLYGFAGKAYLILQSFNGVIALIALLWFVRSEKSQDYRYFDVDPEDYSIAVMPFKERSPEGSNEYLAFGFQDAIINQLNTLNSFDVRSMSAADFFKNKEYSPKEAAEVLGVKSLLEGNLTVIDTLFRLTVSLSNPLSGSLIWSETFKKPLSNILETQLEIALRVVEKLNAQISERELKKLKTFPTDNIEAYNLFILGKYHFNLLTVEDNQKANNYMKRVIKMDPAFSEAYVFLGMTYHLFGGRWLGLMPSDAYNTIEELANQSLEIDPGNPYALFLKANTDFFYHRNYASAANDARLVFEKMDNKEDYITIFSLMLTFSHQGENAVEMLHSYIAKNPTSALAHQAMGNTLLIIGQYDEAITYCNKAMELDPKLIYNIYYIAESLFAKGEYKEAIEQWQKILSIFEMPVFVEGYFRALYYDGQKAAAMKQFARLEEIHKSSPIPIPFIMAKATGTLRDLDRTMTYLQEAYEIHEIEGVALWRETAFDPLRNTPEFKAMMKKFGHSM